MTGLYNLTRRNCKLFFKDKGMFFSAMITPIILLVLYATFLARVYRNSFVSGLPAGMPDMGDIIDATVGGQLISSLLAVSCITVAFCCNLICVQDKARGTVNDLYMTPAGRGCISLGYYLATVFSTLLVCFGAAGIGFTSTS
jgi:multidrug/hemolysin transport system permease protein